MKTLIDKPVVKIITGIRRCGKSTLLLLLRNELLDRSIQEEPIIYIFSADNVANCLRSQNMGVSNSTVYSILHALEDAYMIYKAPHC